MRIKLHIQGGREEDSTPGFAGRYLDARPMHERVVWQKNGPELWRNFLKALVEEQSKAGPRAAALLKVSLLSICTRRLSVRHLYQCTHEHLVLEAGDLTSIEVANTVWPKNEAANPAPNNSNHLNLISYHAPMSPIPAVRTSCRSNTTLTRPGESYNIGTDRIYGYRSINDGCLTVGISYHDPRKPIPPPQPGGIPSRNHPFSLAHLQKRGAIKVMCAKVKKVAKNMFR